MKPAIALVGLMLLCASPSWAGTTGNGWTQRPAAAELPTETQDAQSMPETRPYHGDHAAGVTAKCRDGSHSMSRNHHSACLHHGGVLHWINS